MDSENLWVLPWWLLVGGTFLQIRQSSPQKTSMSTDNVGKGSCNLLESTGLQQLWGVWMSALSVTYWEPEALSPPPRHVANMSSLKGSWGAGRVKR